MPMPPRRSSLHSVSVSRRGSSVKGQLTESSDELALILAVPPLEFMEKVPGYEGITYEMVTVPPPTSATNFDNDVIEINRYKSLLPIALPPAELSEAEVRKALMHYVSKHCCYGKTPARTIDFTFIQATYSFQYQLETFTERRETAWSYVAYTSKCEIDGPEHGQAPLPWQMNVKPKTLFETEVKSIVVPHTSFLKPCHRCTGAGSVQCFDCKGRGWIRCMICHGEGYNSEQERCFHCRISRHGQGRIDCTKCKASGRLACLPCEGTGLIHCFIQLTVTWKTNVSERIVKKVSLPEKLVHIVTGKDVFLEEGPRVSPLQEFPDDAINSISTDLIERHSTLFLDQKILAQRHRVVAVPTASISYQWKGREQNFYLYGLENKIHAPNYPQTCCCGICSII